MSDFRLPKIKNPRKETTLRDISVTIMEEGIELRTIIGQSLSVDNLILKSLEGIAVNIANISAIFDDMKKNNSLQAPQAGEARVDNRPSRPRPTRYRANDEASQVAGLIAIPIALLVAFFTGLNKGLGKKLDRLKSAVLAPFRAIGKLFKAVTTKFLSLEIVKKAAAMIEAFKKVIPTAKIFAVLIWPFKKIMDTIVAAFNTGLKPLQPLLKFAQSIGVLLGKLVFPLTLLLGAIVVIDDWKKNEGKKLPEKIFSAFKALINTILLAPIDLIKTAVAWALDKIGLTDAAEILESFKFTELFSEGADLIYDLIASSIKKVIEKVKEFSLSDTVDKIKLVFSNAMDSIKLKITGIFSDIKDSITNFKFPDIGGFVQKQLTTLLDSLKEAFTNMVTEFLPESVAKMLGVGPDNDVNADMTKPGGSLTHPSLSGIKLNEAYVDKANITKPASVNTNVVVGGTSNQSNVSTVLTNSNGAKKYNTPISR